MPLPINRNQPRIMHVDLNSCFATIEQQANPLPRGTPLVVAAYNSPNGCVVAPSIEAKQYGIFRLLWRKKIRTNTKAGNRNLISL
jgi:nucleotidyltransferase/DNA polymerase involved in DNA repair